MRTKTYIAFDGDEDLMSFRTIQGWSADRRNPFSLENAHDINFARDDSLPDSIINQLRVRLEASKNFVLIIGSATNKNRKGILQYEIRYALRNALPIILVFKNYSADTKASEELWKNTLYWKLPAVLRDWVDDKYCLICPFTFPAVTEAIEKYSDIYLPLKGYNWFWK